MNCNLTVKCPVKCRRGPSPQRGGRVTIKTSWSQSKLRKPRQRRRGAEKPSRTRRPRAERKAGNSQTQKTESSEQSPQWSKSNAQENEARRQVCSGASKNKFQLPRELTPGCEVSEHSTTTRQTQTATRTMHQAARRKSPMKKAAKTPREREDQGRESEVTKVFSVQGHRRARRHAHLLHSINQTAKSNGPVRKRLKR